MEGRKKVEVKDWDYIVTNRKQVDPTNFSSNTLKLKGSPTEISKSVLVLALPKLEAPSLHI